MMAGIGTRPRMVRWLHGFDIVVDIGPPGPFVRVDDLWIARPAHAMALRPGFD